MTRPARFALGMLLPIAGVLLSVQPLAAQEFAIVAAPGARATELADRVTAAGHSSAALTPAEAHSKSAAEWAAFQVVWLLEPEIDSQPDQGAAWRGLLGTSGAIAEFVSAGGTLVIDLPLARALMLADPLGAYLSPYAAEPGSVSAVTASHPLVSGSLADGSSYGGVPLASADLNDVAPAGVALGGWLGFGDGTVIAADAQHARLVERRGGAGRVLLVGVYRSASSNLTHNLIRYAGVQP